MTDLLVRRPILREPSHPGELWREILEDHVKLSVSEAARRLGVSRQSLHEILGGRAACTAEMALRFARLTGGAPELYVQMQLQRDLWLAEHRISAALAEIEPAGLREAEPSAAATLRKRLGSARDYPMPALHRPQPAEPVQAPRAARATRGRAQPS
jgi:addiction module HigA family antidote